MIETWLDRIKALKNKKGYTNEELSRLTGIPVGTLNKILSGASADPKLSNLISLASVFDVSLDYIATGDDTSTIRPTRDEKIMLAKYRALDAHGRELANLVIDKEYERVASLPSSRLLAAGFSPQQAQNGIRRYNYTANALKKRKTQTDVPSKPLRIPIYDLPVSAGVGAFLDGNSTDFITITTEEGTIGADYALRVTGDSMEPRYRDGDIILGHKQSEVYEGELGIFVCGGPDGYHGYFKRFGGDRLVSLNPAYPDIPLDSFESVVCCGKVIGHLPRRDV